MRLGKMGPQLRWVNLEPGGSNNVRWLIATYDLAVYHPCLSIVYLATRSAPTSM